MPNEINLLLNDQHVFYQELSDDSWVSKLMFITDSCEHLHDMSVELQGSDTTLDVTFCYIKAFEQKLEVRRRVMDGERFRY